MEDTSFQGYFSIEKTENRETYLAYEFLVSFPKTRYGGVAVGGRRTPRTVNSVGKFGLDPLTPHSKKHPSNDRLAKYRTKK